MKAICLLCVALLLSPLPALARSTSVYLTAPDDPRAVTVKGVGDGRADDSAAIQHAIFADYTELIQPLSLDEAYLDVTANRRGIETAWATAKEIRARILEETGLTASAGISYNKFLAKLASDQRKPNGQFAVTPEMGAAWVETLPVARFHGVGPVTAEKMKRLGIETGADLRDKSLDFLRTHFGSAAEWYFAIARGQDDRPVNPSRERKSSGSETTFDRDLTDPPEIEAGVLRMRRQMAPVAAGIKPYPSSRRSVAVGEHVLGAPRAVPVFARALIGEEHPDPGIEAGGLERHCEAALDRAARGLFRQLDRHGAAGLADQLLLAGLAIGGV